MKLLEAIGHAVRVAREQAGLSVADVAARAEVSSAALAALERAELGPLTTTDLERIAGTLSLSPGALLSGRAERHEPPSVFLRHAGTMDFDERDLPELDRALEEGRSLGALGPAVGDAGPLRFEPQEAGGDRSERPAWEGYELARRVRAALGLPRAPLPELAALVESRFDVAVVVASLASTKVTALAVKDGTGAAIVLNARDPERATNPLLARVHLAHELCHVLFDPPSGGVDLVVDVVADKRALRAEQRARAFAAELLLPLDGLVELLGQPRGVATLGAARALVAKARGHFGAPHEITAHHLCNVPAQASFVQPDLRDALVGERATTTVRARTTLPGPGEPSRLLVDRVRRAHQAGTLTDGEARRTLGVDVLLPLPWGA